MSEQTLRRRSAGTRRVAAGQRGRKRVRPLCEDLEPRRLLTVQTWIGNGVPDSNWTTPSNWNHGPIAAGDTLAFMSNLASTTSNNDDATVENYFLQFDQGGYDLTGNGIDLADTSGTAILADNSSGNTTLDLPLTLNGNATANVTTAGASVTVDNTVSGATGLTLTTQGAGALILAATSDASGFAGSVDDKGMLQVDTAAGPGSLRLDGGTLSGIGTVGTVTAGASGGTLSPGDAGPGTLTSGAVTLNPSSTLAVSLDGPGAGQYSQLSASGAVNLAGASLSIVLGYAPASSDSYTIIQNTANAPVQGMFNNLPQGSKITVDGIPFVINYYGGPAGNSVTLTVSPPLVANPDFYTLPENDPNFNVFTPGILGNDSPSFGLHPILVTSPTHGTLTLNDDGSFTYLPATGFSGTDSFAYEATDGMSTSSPATVTLVVNPVNEPPQAASITYSGVENNLLTIAAPGVLAGAASPQGLALNAVLVSGPTHFSSFTLNADGSFSYTPAAGFTGFDSFTYMAHDTNGLTSAPATVTVDVQDVPATVISSNDTLPENGSLSIAAPGILTGAINPAANPLSAVLVNNPFDGVVALDTDGSFTYTPFASFSGTDSFTFKANDGTLDSNIATVTLHVTAAPVPAIAVDQNYSVSENTTLAIAAPGLFLGAQNPSGGTLSVQVVNRPLHGTLSPLPLPGDGSFIYTPNTNFFGSDSFTYFFQTNGLNGNLATVTINVAQVPQVPAASNDAYNVEENGTLNVSSPGVLGNDSDPNDALLTAVLASSPADGSLTLNADGSFTYSPYSNFSGTDSFTYLASNGSKISPPAIVSLTVVPVAVAPTSAGSTFTMQEDDQLNVPAPGILGSATDAHGQPIRAVLVNSTLDGNLSLSPDGSFQYTPSAGFVGTDRFTFRAGDGNLESGLSTVTIIVSPITGTTVELAPGVPDHGGFTNVATPTFTGTTLPGLQVVLYSQMAGGAASVAGRAQADSSGRFTVSSGTLPDGTYHFWVDALRPNGLSTGSVDAGSLTIDTTAPRITNVFIVPRTGQIMITFQAGASGLNLASLIDPANYSFSRRSVPPPRAFVITSVTLVPPSSSIGPVTVALTSSLGKPIPTGHYLFEILAGAITDNAGNRLDGRFDGSFPTGGGGPGSAFDALFHSKNHKPSLPVATTHFIPVLTHHRDPRPHRSAAVHRASAAARPAGPLGHRLARQRHVAIDRRDRHHSS